MNWLWNFFHLYQKSSNFSRLLLCCLACVGQSFCALSEANGTTASPPVGNSSFLRTMKPLPGALARKYRSAVISSTSNFQLDFYFILSSHSPNNAHKSVEMLTLTAGPSVGTHGRTTAYSHCLANADCQMPSVGKVHWGVGERKKIV